MRVLHLDGGKELRGGQWQVLRLIEGLYKSGVDSTLLARKGAPLYRIADERGWRVQPLGLRRALALAPQHDILHAHDGHGHTIGALVRPEKLLVSRRVAFPPRSRWKYRRACHYLAVSEFVKQVLVEGGVSAEKITVVADGVPVLDACSGTQLMAPASDDPEKGSALAREAAARAGENLRFSNDLIRDLPEAAVLLYITQSEGLGSGALLGMSAGVPVIASKVGGLPEVIRDGDNGFLVRNNAEEIAVAIRRLMSDGELARRLGAAGRQTVLEKFTVEHMVRNTMELYRQVLS